MDSMTVGIREGRVILFNPQARTALAFSWRAAVDVAHVMMWKARGILLPNPEKVAAVRVRRIEESILVEDAAKGTIVFVAPKAAAHSIGEAMIAQARRLEEIEKQDQVVFDQALLNRKGIPLGLAVHPRLRERAMQEAHWNSQLRRYLPGGVRSEETVGTPTVRKHRTRRH